jgi:hypothetical protein
LAAGGVGILTGFPEWPNDDAQKECPFCNLAPEILAEGPLVAVPTATLNPGHALIVPRRHVASWCLRRPPSATDVPPADDARAIIVGAMPPARSISSTTVLRQVRPLRICIPPDPAIQGDVTDPRAALIIPERAACKDDAGPDGRRPARLPGASRRLSTKASSSHLAKFALLIADRDRLERADTGDALDVPLTGSPRIHASSTKHTREFQGTVLRQNTGTNIAVLGRIERCRRTRCRADARRARHGPPQSAMSAGLSGDAALPPPASGRQGNRSCTTRKWSTVRSARRASPTACASSRRCSVARSPRLAA